MRRLRSLKVGGHKVEVKFYPKRELRGAAGVSWNIHNIIQLCNEYPDSQQEVTLLHEVIHHCLHNLGYDFEEKSTTAIHSERVVEALSQALYQVFRDNDIQFTGEVS